MCILVLIDAGIVVTEILLDLHAIRCKTALDMSASFNVNAYQCQSKIFSVARIAELLQARSRKLNKEEAIHTFVFSSSIKISSEAILPILPKILFAAR